jgi:hypothetical protein
VRRVGAATAVLLVLTVSGTASAQQSAQGFAVDRFSAPVPGSDWLVMDSLGMQGGLGATAGFAVGYAHDSLRVPFAVVADRAVAGFDFAATYERLRLSLAFEAPFVVQGESGIARGYTFKGPDLNLGSHPDTLSDTRIGVDVRFFGAAEAPLRLGASAQLFVPSGERENYVSDDTYRAMGRVLLAGDIDRTFGYAGFLGVHIRPLDNRDVPESPRGSELLAGASAGPRFSIQPNLSLLVGPELVGASALTSLFGKATTAIEGLFSGSLEHRAEQGPTLRLKLGAGAGLHAHFGAPEWRSTLSIEVSGQAR